MRIEMRRAIFIAAGTLASIAALAVCTSSAIAGQRGEFARVCSHALPSGAAGCDAIRLLNPSANWHGSHVPIDPARGSGKHPGKEEKEEQETSSEPSGYHPADLQSAYGLAGATGPSATKGGGQTVAIVDAYDDPNAESDLNAYRSKFGLGDCTRPNGCFRKVNQTGEEANYPSGNTSWSEEISLDLDMISATCPHCKILLVEASSNSLGSLGAAVNEAAALGANAISNSYGAGESSSETGWDAAYYAHAHVAVTASSGDGGYGVEYPAASPFVTAVGGTTLNKSTNARGWNETAWSGAGAGCSAVEPNPGWQPVTGLCATRTVADVSADANPNTGVAVYDSYGMSGWLVFGGTSVSSPIIASVYALAENTSTFTASATGSDSARALYGDTSLNRVREGTNLNTHRCGGAYLCDASGSLEAWTNALGDAVLTPSGWFNGPTGNGTPKGTSGF
jgi:subtilase family serine protease